MKIEGTSAPVAKPELKQAAKQFEAVFLRQLLGEMRRGKLADGVLDSGATDSWREMGDARLAELLAGRFGIGAMVERQLAGKAK